MNKEFIPYELALALKELGFDVPSRDYYRITGSGIFSESKFYNWNDDEKHETAGGMTYVTAPLYQQTFRWFRDKHKLQAEILWRGDMGCFCYKTGNFKYGSHDFSKDDYLNYEEAELACLKKLIEIVKEKT